MCGGFSIYNLSDPKLHASHTKMAYVLPRPLYNARPGQFLPVLVDKKGSPNLETAFWGIHPVWAKTQLINAKAETLFTSRFWQRLAKANRCLVPANGFFEWAQDFEGKVPYFFKDSRRKLFYMAAIYDVNKTDPKKPFNCFAIITTSANKLVGKIHKRMPVILEPKDQAAWLAPATKPAALQAMLGPYPAAKMTSYQVSPSVNNSRNNSEDLIYPLKP